MILSPQEASEHRSIKKQEINWIWTEHRRHKKAKLHWLASQEPLTHIGGIPNTNWELEQSCGQTVHEGLVLGDLKVSEAVKAFLRLDPKFRVYGKLDKEVFETQTLLSVSWRCVLMYASCNIKAIFIRLLIYFRI